MSDLRNSIAQHIYAAWDDTAPPATAFYPEEDVLETIMEELSEDAREHLVEFSQRLIEKLIGAGHLKQGDDDPDLEKGALGQLRRLQELTGSINETTRWLAGLNHLVARGVKRIQMVALTEDFTIHPVSLDDVGEGDRIRVTTRLGNVHEVTLAATPDDIIIWHGGRIPVSEIEKTWLLERPTQHPNPEKHQLIYCGDLMMDFFWDTRTEEYVSIGDTAFSQDPDDFVTWSPAKVVPAGDTE